MAMAGPLTMPNYRKNLMRAGFEEAELDDGGNDRVIDAVVAWGDESALVDRVRAHREAGATHVCRPTIACWYLLTSPRARWSCACTATDRTRRPQPRAIVPSL